MLVRVFFQRHDRHGLAWRRLALGSDCDAQCVDCPLAADRRCRVAHFQTFVRPREALQRHADLHFPALLGAMRYWRQFRFRLSDRHHHLTQYVTVAPRDIAVDERERIDCPSRVRLDLGLLGAVNPMATFVHLQNDGANSADVFLKGAQSDRQGRNGREVCDSK